MFKYHRRDELTVNLTPLIDVVFLLLIFFMVSTSFTRETQLNVTLPEATGEALDIEEQVLEISIDAAGDFYVNARALANSQPETLKRAMIDIARDNPRIPVVISADAKAPYQAVATAMDTAGQLGFSNLTMTAQKPDASQ